MRKSSVGTWETDEEVKGLSEHCRTLVFNASWMRVNPEEQGERGEENEEVGCRGNRSTGSVCGE